MMEKRSGQRQYKSYGSTGKGGPGEALGADGERSSRLSPNRLWVLAVLGVVGLYGAFAFSLQNRTTSPVSDANTVKDVIKGEKSSSGENAVLAEVPQQGKLTTPLFENGLPSPPSEKITVGGNTSPSSLTELSVYARNEYGTSDPVTLALYGFDLLAEPYRDTTLSVESSDSSTASTKGTDTKFNWYLAWTDDDGSVVDGVEPELNGEYGAEVVVNLKKPGQVYRLTVSEVLSDKNGGLRRTNAVEAPASVSFLVTCKYVRRELRQLTDQDLDDFMYAMGVFYDVPGSESPAKYDPDFVSAKDMAALHISLIYCYHRGLQFITAHTAFNMVVERSLQMVNPRVSLAFWDSMIESSTLGTKWIESEIFGPKMFGSAVGSAETNFQVLDGRFANVSSIHDSAGDLLPKLRPGHNAYGYINANYNYQDLPYLTRTHSYCGLTGSVVPPSCNAFIACFEDNLSLFEWENCMESKEDMNKFAVENPRYSKGLLSFSLEFIIQKGWPSNHFKDYNTCDTSCDVGSDKFCGCTCNLNVDDLTDDEVYSMMEEMMEFMSSSYDGYKYVYEDTSKSRPWGFKQSMSRLTDDENALLWRKLLIIGCAPAKQGYMSGVVHPSFADPNPSTLTYSLQLYNLPTGASPLDPIFWVLHPVYEKGLHILMLSSRYSEDYDFSWVDGSCYGSGEKEFQPMTEKLMGVGTGTELLTNEELFSILHPTTGKLSYTYTSFNSWGTCQNWYPCPECQS